MEGFRKPYEYEEEKGMGGLLTLFFVMLLSVEVLLALAVLVQGYAILKTAGCLGMAFLVLGTAYLAFIAIACIALRRAWRHAVPLAKVFLVVRVLFLAPASVLLFTVFSRNPRIASGFRPGGELVFFGLAVPLAYILLFSGLWYWYLSCSRRVGRFVQAAAARRADRCGAGPA